MKVSGKRIAILGDSHVDGSVMGQTLEKLLTEGGATVKRFGWGGSAARTWLAGKPALKKHFTVEGVKNEGPYDIVIISLGTNDGANAGVGTQDPARLKAEAEKSVAQIKKIADTIGGGVTFWVEPPPMLDRAKHYTNFNIDFVRNAGRAVFGTKAIDSTRIGTPDGDGVHPGGKAGRAWAELVNTTVLNAPDEATMLPSVLTLGGRVSPWASLAVLLAVVGGGVAWKLRSAKR